MATYRVENIKGKWNVVQYAGDSRQKRVIGAGPEAKKRADHFAAQLTAKLVEQDLGLAKPDAMSFSAFAERWLEKRIKPHQKPRYYEFCKYIVDRHLIPLYGASPLSKIDRENITDLIADKMNERDPETFKQVFAESTVKGMVRVMSAIFSFAVEEKRTTGIADNPAAKLGRFFSRRRETAIERDQVYDAAQVAHLFVTVAKWYPREEGEYAVKLACLTGLREGELFGLQWPDWNFKDGYITVRRTVYYRKEGLVVETPKSGKRRDVEVPDDIIPTYRRVKTLREAEFTVEGKAVSPWVFPDPEEPTKPVNRDRFCKYVWYALVDKAGLHRIRFHDLRHTFATVNLSKGAPIEWVSRQLGHADISTTYRVYHHFRPGQYGVRVRNLMAQAVNAETPKEEQHARTVTPTA